MSDLPAPAPATDSAAPVSPEAAAESTSPPPRPRRRLPLDSTQYFELVKIMLGFILTGVVGTAFSQWYKKTETDQASFASFRAKSIEVHDGIATLAGKRLFTCRLFLTALTESKDDAYIKASYSRAEAEWLEWNATIARTQQSVHFFFSGRTVTQWDLVAEDLKKLNEDCEVQFFLYCKNGHPDRKGPDELKQRARKLQDPLLALSDLMQGEIYSAKYKEKWRFESAAEREMD